MTADWISKYLRLIASFVCNYEIFFYFHHCIWLFLSATTKNFFTFTTVLDFWRSTGKKNFLLSPLALCIFKLQRTVATVSSLWQRCVRFDGPRFEPLTLPTDSDVAYHNANLRISFNVRIWLFSGVMIFNFTLRILATAVIYEKNVEGL